MKFEPKITLLSSNRSRKRRLFHSVVLSKYEILKSVLSIPMHSQLVNSLAKRKK